MDLPFDGAISQRYRKCPPAEIRRRLSNRQERAALTARLIQASISGRGARWHA